MRRRAGCAGVGREVEQDHRQLARRALRPPQHDQLGDLRRQRLGALGAALHFAGQARRGERAAPSATGARLARQVGAPAEHARQDRAVEFGDGDHHRRFDRQQALAARAPLLQRLELDRVCRYIGHIELRQHFLGGLRVVIGRATDQAEPGQRHDRIDHRLAIDEEKFLDRRARIQPAGEGRDDPQPLGLQRGDRSVIMAGVTAEQVGAQHQQPDRADRDVRFRKRLDRVGHPPGQCRMIDADIGIFLRRIGAGVMPGIAIGQRANHVDDIVIASRQPILQSQEIGPHVLRGAGDEAQHLGQAAQHFHLPGARRSTSLGRSAQPLEQGEWALGRLVHAIVAHAGQLDDFAARHQPEHRRAMFAPRLERRHDRADMVVEEQHRCDDNVTASDIRNAAVERTRGAVPVGGGVEADADVRAIVCELRRRPLRRARQMIVEGDDDDPEGLRCDGRANGHNAPLRHRGCRA